MALFVNLGYADSTENLERIMATLVSDFVKWENLRLNYESLGIEHLSA